MHINSVFAGIAVSDMTAALGWYERFLGQAPSAVPMPSLAEWHLPGGYLQLVADVARAGSSLITLDVNDLDAVAGELTDAGLADRLEISHGQTVRFTQTRDPDGNTITLVQSSRDDR